jgi:hypothetical protein
MHIGDVGDPELIEAGQLHAARQIGHDAPAMAGCRWWSAQSSLSSGTDDCPRASAAVPACD